MKRIFCLFAVLAVVVMAFIGCQKGDSIEPKKDNIFDEAKPMMVDDKPFVYNYKLRYRKRLKGLIGGEDWIDTARAYTVGNLSESYKTIKVVRPNGKYFYIMIENFRYKDGNNGWAYNWDESLVPKYGRLYDWNTAYNLRRKVYMKLPLIDGETLEELPRKVNVGGRLPNIEDLKNLLEANSVAFLPEQATPLDEMDVFGNLYYDAFLAGIEDKNYDVSAAEHSLAGIRDGAGSCSFRRINEFGVFWTNMQYNMTVNPNATAHHAFRIAYKNQYSGEEEYYFCAYINVPVDNAAGSSVRYVFEPYYK